MTHLLTLGVILMKKNLKMAILCSIAILVSLTHNALAGGGDPPLKSDTNAQAASLEFAGKIRTSFLAAAYKPILARLCSGMLFSGEYGLDKEELSSFLDARYPDNGYEAYLTGLKILQTTYYICFLSKFNEWIIEEDAIEGSTIKDIDGDGKKIAQAVASGEIKEYLNMNGVPVDEAYGNISYLLWGDYGMKGMTGIIEKSKTLRSIDEGTYEGTEEEAAAFRKSAFVLYPFLEVKHPTGLLADHVSNNSFYTMLAGEKLYEAIADFYKDGPLYSPDEGEEDNGDLWGDEKKIFSLISQAVKDASAYYLNELKELNEMRLSDLINSEEHSSLIESFAQYTDNKYSDIHHNIHKE